MSTVRPKAVARIRSAEGKIDKMLPSPEGNIDE
ncbi:MAG: hypothetical protein JWR07_4046 [Nevskia sp.]|nr:hypothetical protein [Nevskia sp.]